MQPAKKRLQNERGQTTIFFIAAFWTLFLFLAFVVNLGEAINRRVKLQMVADAGAWTGASKQASELNGLSDLNDYEHNFVFIPAALLSSYWTLTLEPLADISDILWEVGNPIYKGLFEIKDQLGNENAASAAIEVTNYNVKELFPKESVDYVSNPVLYAAAELIEKDKVSKMEGENTYYIGYTPPWTFTTHGAIDLSTVWYKAKKGHETVNFFWWAHVSETGAPVLPSVFRLPAMTAVALAKPTNGELDPEGDAHSNGYSTRMLPMKDHFTNYMGYLATTITYGQLAITDFGAATTCVVGGEFSTNIPFWHPLVH
ncbi:MAG: Tad domain-containing protein [Acidobacteriia bacterium]|nr:Tad domain-containing protein [Terriglobia bacterium]